MGVGSINDSMLNLKAVWQKGVGVAFFHGAGPVGWDALNAVCRGSLSVWLSFGERYQLRWENARSRSPSPPATMSADTTPCWETCGQAYLQVCHYAPMDVNLSPFSEGEHSTFKALFKIAPSQQRPFPPFLVTLSQERWTKIPSTFRWVFGVPAKPYRPEQQGSPWLDFGSLILFCYSGQTRSSCCVKQKECNFPLCIFHGFMCEAEWLRGPEFCVLSAVVVWSQSLYTFYCQAPLYQASPNCAISRCLYRAAHCHVHGL